MSPSLKQKEAIPVFLVALVLACFAISRSVQAAEPPGIQNVNEFNTPFHRQFFLSMDPGQISDSRSFDLPAGKTLVVEFVSARASLPAGEQPILLEILSGSLVHDLLWNFVAQHGDRDSFVGSQQIRMYAVNNVAIAVTRNISAGSAQIAADVTGYLVNTP